jgi:hypothetical protein
VLDDLGSKKGVIVVFESLLSGVAVCSLKSK